MMSQMMAPTCCLLTHFVGGRKQRAKHCGISRRFWAKLIHQLTDFYESKATFRSNTSERE